MPEDQPQLFNDNEKVYIQKIKLCMIREKTSDLKIAISSPEDIADLALIKEELLSSDREKFICIHLDTKHRIISYETVSIGSLSATLVHPREVFKGAMLSNASAIIFCHNHPSGVPRPSSEDIELTKRLSKGGELLGIPVLDHIVFGEQSHVSFKEEGLL